MKKKPKLEKVKKLRKKSAPLERISNENIEQHRQRVLASARKYKYPMQVSRHRVLIWTIVIAISALLLFLLFGWWSLYQRQTMDDFFYRATQVLPLPVASVDGTNVGYDDYLRRLRSSVTYLQRNNEINLGTEDGKRQLEFLKRQEITEAEKDAYAESLSIANDVKVTSEEVNNFIDTERQSAKAKLSESAFEKAVLQDFYGWTLDDYRQIVHDRLVRRKVSFAIDSNAKQKAEDIKGWLEGGADFAGTAKQYSDDPITKVTGGVVGKVMTNSVDTNGLIAAAQKLKPGQVSPIIEGVDGYYIIRLVEKDDNSVTYSMIKVNLTEFDKQFMKLQQDGKIHEFIKITDQTADKQQ